MEKAKNLGHPREIKAVCLSRTKGRKSEVEGIILIADVGVKGDFHAGSSRQVSLLAEESVIKLRAKGMDIKPGDFGENIIFCGVDLKSLPVGAKLKIGSEAEVEITQIGKECVERCQIYYRTGDCIMPREGVFAKVIKGGKIKSGDKINL